MGKRGKAPQRYMIDGKGMTAQEIADMLGITLQALWNRKSRLGGVSYQLIVNMYRENQIGRPGDRQQRYLIEGRWMSTGEIADMLEIKKHSLATWRWANPGKGMEDAITHFRQYQTGERQRRGGDRGGRPPSIIYKVGGHSYTVVEVARKFGVAPQSVRHYLQRHGGDMAATLKHYRERERKKREKAEKEIMKALGF